MKVPKRRRRENKTDYLKRLKLLKSRKPRIVFRKTNRYLIAQYVTSKEAQDSVVFGFNSKFLINYGWPSEFSGSLKSIPASYLLGFLVGKNIINKKLETPILDIGMLRNVKKSRIFGFIKGLKDAGIEINCKEEFFPREERIFGKHLKKDFTSFFNKIKSNIEKTK
jgi:large subunit ribosomal protein L18